MPSVVMKRSMIIFGARVLRSGNRFWPARSGYNNNNNHKESSSAATEPPNQPWIHLLEKSDGGAKGHDLRLELSDSTPMDIDQSRSDRKVSFPGDDRYGLVYHRKRKTSDLSDVMFGKKYYRKRSKKLKRTVSSFSLFAQSVDGDRSGWLVSFLTLILSYMSENAGFRLSSLSSLMHSKPLSLVFSSHGINFSWAPSWVTRSGTCKIYGSRCFTPLFTLEFSALPSCFMYMHSGFHLNYGFSHRVHMTLVDGVSSNTVPATELTVEPVLFVKKINRNKTKKRRAHVRTVAASTRRSKRTIPRNADSTIRNRRLAFENIDRISSRANILVFEKKVFYRIEGAVIKLEMSTLRKWSITLTKNRIFQFNFHPLESMKPCSINHLSNRISWRDNRYNWRLEFVSRKSWLKFREFYRVCFLRNSRSATGGEVNIPIYREIQGYDDDYEKNEPFVRTELYTRVVDDEGTRMLRKKTAVYEMDSDDEEWLEKFNRECAEVNEHHQKLSMEDFELIIDASEENLATNPKEKDASNLYVDLENKDSLNAVFSYWRRKRKKNHSSLCRIYESYQLGKDRLRINKVERKKRTSNRKRRQPGSGKFSWQSLADQHEIEEEKMKRGLKICEAAAAKARILERVAIEKRKIAQMLMMKADLATFKASEAGRIADAAKYSEWMAAPLSQQVD